jgi:cytochrome c oxidase assembly factor CtaG
LKRRIEDIWRQYFVIAEGFAEIEAPTIGVEGIYQASGHLSGFSDPLTSCKECKEVYRADHLIKHIVEVPDALSNEALFSAHMVQHILLMLLAPACLLLGTPGYWIRTLYDLPVLKRLLPIVTHPLVTLIVFNAVMWIWHVPSLYEGALRDANVHIMEHLMFLAAGVLMWLPVIHDVPPGHVLSYPARMAYLFASMVSSSILGAIFTFAPDIAFPFYGNAPLAFGLTPMTDQQLAGLIMWVPGSGVFFIAILAVFAAWLNSEDRKAKAESPPPPYVQ